jgi:hypothetical protein
MDRPDRYPPPPPTPAGIREARTALSAWIRTMMLQNSMVVRQLATHLFHTGHEAPREVHIHRYGVRLHKVLAGQRPLGPWVASKLVDLLRPNDVEGRRTLSALIKRAGDQLPPGRKEVGDDEPVWCQMLRRGLDAADSQGDYTLRTEAINALKAMGVKYEPVVQEQHPTEWLT